VASSSLTGLCKVDHSVHRDNLDVDGLGDALIGAAIGNAIIPGLGGVIGGAVAGRFGVNY
jgi:hypothetical protein